VAGPAGLGRATTAFGRHERALLAPGAQREGYLERAISGHRRKKLRRQRRLLAKIAPLTFATTRDAGSIEAALQDFLVLEAGGWKGLAGAAIVNDPAIRDFVQSAVMGLAADGQVRIDRLLLNGAPIAATVTLTSGDAAWSWKITYNEAHARSSPGVQLVCDFTASLLAEPRTLRVDSCASPGHPMIDHIWRERLALSDRLIALRPSAMPFALACRIETLRRSTLATAKAVRNRIRGH
jgi:CelD/BcsL family acetyltransferase involved in cellulose biosynthesis